MTLEDLGRRAVACKHWRWMHGMVTFGLMTDDLPDLSSPATLGCLLALVREAWPKGEATTNIHANYSPERGHYREWTCYYCTGNDWRQTHASTEAEALVAALEVAP